jgi:hypothetical protein
MSTEEKPQGPKDSQKTAIEKFQDELCREKQRRGQYVENGDNTELPGRGEYIAGEDNTESTEAIESAESEPTTA